MYYFLKKCVIFILS